MIYSYKLNKVLTCSNEKVYNKFINWVRGEFDLYLISESTKLDVYFPNGMFSIGKIPDKNINIEINIKSSSESTCNNMMNQLQSIYNHVVVFMKQKKL